MALHIETGRKGEAIAEAYLRQEGYTILGRNIANPLGKRLGEIDIVAQIKDEIVFVEVKTLWKTQADSEYLPEHQVTRSKLVKLDRIAEYYLRQQGWRDRDFRFDVIAITLQPKEPPLVHHIEHAFLSF